MTERRYDPTVGEWRFFASAPTGPADPAGAGEPAEAAAAAEPCPFCPTTDQAAPTRIPRERYQFAVLDEHHSALAEQAVSEIVLYTDRHDTSLAQLEVPHLARLVEVWAHRYRVLAAREELAYVFIFDDGASGGHPHGRIHGYPEIPPVPRRELAAAAAHQRTRGRCVFCDVVARETGLGTRVVAENPYFVAYVPFAARFSLEVQITAKRHATSLLDLTDPERLALAEMIKVVLTGYSALSADPYVLSMHQAPTNDSEWLPISHLHLELIPGQPSPDRIGPELGAGAFINEILPEAGAARLRAAVRR